MRALGYLSAGMLLAASLAGGQTAANHISLGDKEYVAMNAGAALKHYEAAITDDPKNYEALWKAARSDVDLGSYEKNDEMRGVYYKNGELYARRAVEANPSDAEGTSTGPRFWEKRPEPGTESPDQVRQGRSGAGAGMPQDQSQARRLPSRHGDVERRGNAAQRLHAHDGEEFPRRAGVRVGQLARGEALYGRISRQRARPDRTPSRSRGSLPGHG